MIRVYLAEIRKEENLHQERISHQEQSEQARRLLDMALEREYPGICVPAFLERDINGKPYLVDYPDIFINISHSGPYLACALGDKPVGIDVEKWKKRRPIERIVKKFHPLEQEAYQERPEEEREAFFYDLWVLKESFMKAAGLGLRIPLQDFCVLPGKEVLHDLNGKQYFTRVYMLQEEGLSLAVCWEGEDFPQDVICLEL